MGKLVFLLLIGSTAAIALARPWIGVVGAYAIVVLGPQYVWFYHFEGLRAALMIQAPTLLGFGLAAFRGEYSFDAVRSRRNAYVLMLWLAFAISYFFGPYVSYEGELRFADPAWAMSLINKMLILYFVACICITTPVATRAMAYVAIFSCVYLTYWANSAYLSGSVFGRMPGPSTPYGDGVYTDGNNFALFFVATLPFLWYAGLYSRNLITKWGLWLVIPLGWHAIFLTGSRGGLLGLAATLGLIVWNSKRRVVFGAFLLPVFVVAYVWQAGPVMKERATTISEYKTESSAASRLEAWDAALSMMVRNGLTGVGLASFVPAFPDHSNAEPREAHNTFFQISGESGLLAGAMYIAIVLASLSALRRNSRYLRKSDLEDDDELRTLFWVNESTYAGFSGLVLCSLFLSMQLFEIFYFLLVIVNAVTFQVRRRLAQLDTAVEDSAKVGGAMGREGAGPRRRIRGMQRYVP